MKISNITGSNHPLSLSLSLKSDVKSTIFFLSLQVPDVHIPAIVIHVLVASTEAMISFFHIFVICSPYFYVESHIATVSASISSNDSTWAKRNFNLLLPLIYYKFVPIICVNFICLPLQCHVHASTSKNVFKECHAFKR